ncbi:monovalent cation/H+ antiporter complex subunit F [Mycolicibacterium pulveris]|uniref:monovalent cation/H+ antiporter complex subunit F n=1 Tax=Mycolicibacterium pulveris TaxID=36813 RepID=UPI003CFAA92B
MTWVWVIASVLISAAAGITMYRMLAGPSTLDRLVSLDTLTAVTMCGIGTWAAYSQDSSVTYAMAAMALISFVGTVSVARFRVRDVEKPRGGRGSR